MKVYIGTPMNYGASPKLFEFAKYMRYNPTEAEKIMWGILTSVDFVDYKFRRQHPIAVYIADFYCHKLKLVIEIDGGYHVEEAQAKYDITRDEEMQQYGITILRFTNQLVLNSGDEVTKQLKSFIMERKN